MTIGLDPEAVDMELEEYSRERTNGHRTFSAPEIDSAPKTVATPTVASLRGAAVPAAVAELAPTPDVAEVAAAPKTSPTVSKPRTVSSGGGVVIPPTRYAELGQAVAEFVERSAVDADPDRPRRPIVITGAAVGLPGADHLFDPSNMGRLLDGEQFIKAIPAELRDAILDQHITRLVKSAEGSGSFESIDDVADVIKLAGRARAFDPIGEFGFDAGRAPALDSTTCMAIAAGFDALRDAGIPLVQHYKTTHIGTRLPERWGLPDDLRDDTGIIFASGMPGLDAFAGCARDYYTDKARREQLVALQAVRASVVSAKGGGAPAATAELDRRIASLEAEMATKPYVFDRRFLFRVLSMGHSQFAEIIGARGPNTQLNAACASTTQAFAVAEDWIRAGHCRRVVVIAADNVTSDNLLGWIGAGFLATGAAATDELVEDAATPFDRRRHGMILGMGAAAIVLEEATSADERAIRPITEMLSAVTANSAFHGTRLDVNHISGVMETLISQAEQRWGLDRAELAPQMVFVSHETYTPARGGSAAAEVASLRAVFGHLASQIIMANTKGLTGHPMGVGIEDILAIKSLETGLVPPIPNFKEVDPELGELTLSQGGSYPVRYALRLAAGFGSQISMTLQRWVPTPDGIRRSPDQLGYEYRIADASQWKDWLAKVTGIAEPIVEVVQHQLRVVERRPRLVGNETVSAPHETPAEMATAGEPVAAVGSAAVGSAAVGSAVVPSFAPSALAESPAPATPVLASVADAPAQPVPSTPASKALALSALKASPDGPTVPPAGTPPSVDEVRERVLGVVADKTGYPKDILDLELDLEADLGVDTVKQADLFASVRESYGIERDDNLKLRDFPTLNHVIHFVLDRAPGAMPTVEATAAPPAAPVDEAAAPPSAQARRESRPEAFAGLDACEVVPRRVPVPVLRPPLALCRETSVTFESGSRVVVMRDRGGVGDALVQTLRGLGAEPLVLDGSSGIEAVVSQLRSWTADGPVQGVYWLPALDIEPLLEDLGFAGWKEGLRVRVKLLAATMRALYEQVSGPGTFLVSATRMGGRHGYDAAGATAPMGGAVTGFTKTYKRERPDCLVKAVDVHADADVSEVVSALIEETRRDPGAVEVGRQGGVRWSVGLREQAVADGQRGLALDPDTVFVVTGAAGSIVSAIVADLAAASGGVFHLLDLVPEPDPANPDLDRFVTDPAGLRRELFQRMKDRGERATPALVEREMAKLERAKAAVEAMESVRRAGGEPFYHSVDLRDTAAVAASIDAVRQRHGRVDVLLHAAGLEISRSLPDKSDQEYDLAFDVKSDGWFNLLSAIGDMPLGATVCFSSVAGRFGNGGQSDYSAANDLLCKTTSSFRTTRPGTRGMAVDWTAWGGIGMATRGSIPKMMELAGIDMLSPQVAIPWIRRELVAGGGRGEVVVGQRLGLLTKEIDPDDGLDRSALSAVVSGPMVGDVIAMGVWRPLTVTTVLDPGAQGFLDHHRIEGVPVLPGVMGAEAFAEVASLMLPGWRVQAVEGVQFLVPFKFYRSQPREITVEATFSSVDGDEIVADCRLLGSRVLPNQSEPQVTTHFTGRVRMVPVATTLAEVVPAAAIPTSATGAVVGRDAIYRVLFHGPTYQVLESSWRQGDCQIGLMAQSLPPNHSPADLPLVAAPRVLELCFHTAGLWELGTSGRLALPQHVTRVVVQGSEQEVSGRLYSVVRPKADGDGFDAEAVDDAGRVHLRVEGYRTVVLPVPVDVSLLGPLQAAVQAGVR